ncbi:unnamed protein product [Danaus chrysippus]|uniref:(African queen) hypothetical protein n=1 Tax=Danaus chrysippus TaxID=151541 RepID=A0A8J2QS70_9NEOP|nr:unnamed protein product [Danaus chrysippus]
MDDAQTSSAVVTDASKEPGSSRQEQSIIIQENEPMESAHTGTTVSNCDATMSCSQQKDKKDSLPTQEEQELSMPCIDEATADTPALVMDNDEEVQPISNVEHQVLSNQAISQFTEQPEPIQEPQISADPSIQMTGGRQESHMDDAVNSDSTSYHLLNSLKISAQLYSQKKKARRLIPTQRKVERIMNPMNSSNSFNQNGSLSTRSVKTEQQHHMSYHNEYLPTNRRNLEQDLLIKSSETNNYEQRANSRTIRTSTPSIGQNSIISSTSLCQTSKIPQQKQTERQLLYQQDSQRQPQRLKRRINISIKPKSNRQTPYPQVTNKTLSPILSKVLNSVRRTLSSTRNQYLQNEQQFQENHGDRELVNKNHLRQIDNTSQTDEVMEEKTSSGNPGANSDSDAATDNEVNSHHEMPSDEACIERTNNFYGPGIPSGSSSAVRSIASQNSPNNQRHFKLVLEQQMLDNFAALFTQMESTLRYTTDMYNTLRGSILDAAKAFKKLLLAVKEFNSMQNSATNSSSSRNQREDVSQCPEERHNNISAPSTSSNTKRHSKEVANNAPKKKRKLWRFVLPPEYDPHDTRWTLKYRNNLLGLVEITPQSGVYVSYGDLKYCQHVSIDCKSLARRLLEAIFNRNALSVCLSMSELAQASDNVRSNTRPKLDVHAVTVLLNFVIEHGLQHGWNTDLQPILNTLHSKIKELRFKYGVMVEC